MNKCPVSVVVLTYNEEINLRACLASVVDLTADIFMVDSFSTDKTLEIAREYTPHIYQNSWVDFAQQRNWALDHLPLPHEWVLFLDADERLTPELGREIKEILAGPAAAVEGYYIKRNFYFLGKRLKYGGYQRDYILRLVKRSKARLRGRGVREYVAIRGAVGYLKYPMIHEDRKDLGFWIDKHNKYASWEAQELIRLQAYQGLLNGGRPAGDGKIEHYGKIWWREKVWVKLPILIRPLFYFFYRYVIQLGFLDGKAGLIYTFLHGFWYQFLIDAKYYEQKELFRRGSL